MKSEISEFSYGFALTNELVGWMTLAVAPVFPSLIEEGKVGGGYDVKLDKPGFPLFIQFKRSDCMVRKTAKEYQAIKSINKSLSVPYHRFPITKSSTSDQHELLLALDNGSNLVFYAAPRFHRLREINSTWRQAGVVQNSIFFSPQSIGHLDTKQHYVAFDKSNAWLCSKPRSLDVFSIGQLEERLINNLKEGDQALGERLPDLLYGMREAEERGKASAEARRGFKLDSNEVYIDEVSITEDLPVLDSSTLRDPKPLDDEAAILRQVADAALNVFNTQVMIVQSK